ncbi:Uncharacterised protein [Mycobacteroides abscessus subsp. massiliense]|nr:Uncharacterised protein [Mycobacteroides abscessus subsp. massiliense]
MPGVLGAAIFVNVAGGIQMILKPREPLGVCDLIEFLIKFQRASVALNPLTRLIGEHAAVRGGQRRVWHGNPCVTEPFGSV